MSSFGPIIMHINYCEQGQSLAQACRKAVDWGFDGIEFRRRRLANPQSEVEYLDELERAVSGSGLRHVLFGYPGPDLMLADESQRELEVQAASAFYTQAAQRFHCTLCNTFAGALRNPDSTVPATQFARQGSACATKEHWQWAAAGFQRLGANAEKLGLRLAFETHMSHLHDLPEPTLRLLAGIGSPALGALLDYANMFLFPKPPPLAEVIAAFGDQLYYVHLKNVRRLLDGTWLGTPLSDGDINHREFLRLLRAQGYAGPLCIESPWPGDREWFAQQDLAYLKSLIADMESEPGGSV